MLSDELRWQCSMPPLAFFLIWSLTPYPNAWINNKRLYKPWWKARTTTFLPFFSFWCLYLIFCSFSQLLPCMMDHEVVVRGNIQVNTAEADCKTCSNQNKLLLCSILKKKRQVDCFERRKIWQYLKKHGISYLPCSFNSTGYEEAYNVFNFCMFCARVLSSSAFFSLHNREGKEQAGFLCWPLQKNLWNEA